MVAPRFLDLPREIRDKIYGVLLCTFPQPDSITHGLMLPKKDFSPSILRVNKQIYSESYDVMIKGNRFVLVTSTGGLDLANMLKLRKVPGLAFDLDDGTQGTNKSEDPVFKPLTRRFRGYAIHVTIGNSNSLWRSELRPSALLEPCNIIMLFRDLELLCHAIMDRDDRLENYICVMTLAIDLAPVTRRPPYQLEAPTAYFSSTKIQGELLEPFRRQLRNKPGVTISGTVDKSLVQAAKKDFARDIFEDTNALIESLTATKAQGTELFKKGNVSCIKYWVQFLIDVQRARDEPMWTRLVEQGGSSFVAKVAELHYTTNLNLVAIWIKRLEEGHRDVIPSIHNAYDAMEESTEERHWGIEHSWKPSPAQEMKTKFRYAKFIRLWGEPTLVPFAVGYIAILVRANPNDAAVLDEQRKIAAWMASAGPVDESLFNAAMDGQL